MTYRHKNHNLVRECIIAVTSIRRLCFWVHLHVCSFIRKKFAKNIIQSGCFLVCKFACLFTTKLQNYCTDGYEFLQEELTKIYGMIRSIFLILEQNK